MTYTVETVGRTGWDFLYNILNWYSLLVIIIIGLIFVLVWVIIHPEIVEKWNVIICTILAKYFPKKRKKAFEKRITCMIKAINRKFTDEVPSFFHKLLPYGLKIEWIREDDSIESMIQDEQVIVYVPNYKDEPKLTVGILYNYCVRGF